LRKERRQDWRSGGKERSGGGESSRGKGINRRGSEQDRKKSREYCTSERLQARREEERRGE
jgi:hypothetical protein